MTSPEKPGRTLPAQRTPPDDDTEDQIRRSGDTVSLARTDSSPSPEAQRGEHAPTDEKSFGEYELIEEIARGGMGVVYKARQRTLNRTVALKMILSGQFANEEEILRFRAEAEAAAGLDHPGIVPIYEVGHHQGRHFFSMGFIEGDSLAKRIAHSPLASHQAAETLLGIADAVHYAHERGIVHRDLKPGNVLLKGRGSTSDSQPQKSASGSLARPFPSSGSRSTTLDAWPMITDFGLAKRLEADSSITASGQILGTPSYMPPEQAKGHTEQIGVKSDVYAIGAILYCMLTGRPPFHAASLVETIRHVCELDPVPPRQINPEISRDLETICLKCLEKEPARRYGSAQKLAEDLEAFLDGRPVKSRPIGNLGKMARWAKRKPVVASLAATVMLVTMIGVAGIVWQWRVAQSNYWQSQQYLREARSNLTAAQQAQRSADEQRDRAETSFGLARTTVHRLLTVVPNHELIQKPGMEPVKKQLQTLGRDHYLKLAEARPDDWKVRRELAESRFFLAMTSEDVGELQEAVGEYSAAAEIFQQLADREPDSGEHQRNLAACYGNLANVQINLGMRSEGIESYRRIRDMQQRIVEKQPDDSISELHLAMTHLNLGLLELDDGQIDAAMKSAIKASEMADRLQAQHGDDMQVLFMVAKARSTIGRLRWERQDNLQALSDYGRAAEAYHRLLDHSPDDPQLHAEISGVFNDIAMLNTEQGDRKSANENWNRCIEHGEIAHNMAPEVLLYRENLCIKLRNRGLDLRNAGQFDRALESLTASRNLNSENPAWLFTTAIDVAGFMALIDANSEVLPKTEIARRDEFTNQAIKWLTDAVDRGFSDASALETATELKDIRDDPALLELLSRMKEDQKNK